MPDACTCFPCASRHGKNLNSDPWRKLQLWKATANKGHPFARWAARQGSQEAQHCMQHARRGGTCHPPLHLCPGSARHRPALAFPPA